MFNPMHEARSLAERERGWGRIKKFPATFHFILRKIGYLCVSVQYMVKRDGDARMDIFIFSKKFFGGKCWCFSRQSDEYEYTWNFEMFTKMELQLIHKNIHDRLHSGLHSTIYCTGRYGLTYSVSNPTLDIGVNPLLTVNFPKLLVEYITKYIICFYSSVGIISYSFPNHVRFRNFALRFFLFANIKIPYNFNELFSVKLNPCTVSWFVKPNVEYSVYLSGSSYVLNVHILVIRNKSLLAGDFKAHIS